MISALAAYLQFICRVCFSVCHTEPAETSFLVVRVEVSVYGNQEALNHVTSRTDSYLLSDVYASVNRNLVHDKELIISDAAIKWRVFSKFFLD